MKHEFNDRVYDNSIYYKCSKCNLMLNKIKYDTGWREIYLTIDGWTNITKDSYIIKLTCDELIIKKLLE